MERRQILNKIKERIENNDSESEQDVPRLVCCYLLAGVLANTQGSTMQREVAHLFEDLDNACIYEWLSHIIDYLEKQLKKAVKLKFCLVGCAILLPIFLCEICDIIPPTFPHDFPSYLKWDMNKAKVQLIRLRSKRLKVLRTKLKATSGEQHVFAELVAHQRGCRKKTRDVLGEGNANATLKANEGEGCLDGETNSKYVVDADAEKAMDQPEHPTSVNTEHGNNTPLSMSNPGRDTSLDGDCRGLAHSEDEREVDIHLEACNPNYGFHQKGWPKELGRRGSLGRNFV